MVLSEGNVQHLCLPDIEHGFFANGGLNQTVSIDEGTCQVVTVP